MIISMERGRKGKKNKTLRSWCEETGNKLNQVSDSSSEVSSAPFKANCRFLKSKRRNWPACVISQHCLSGHHTGMHYGGKVLFTDAMSYFQQCSGNAVILSYMWMLVCHHPKHCSRRPVIETILTAVVSFNRIIPPGTKRNIKFELPWLLI